MILSFRNRYMFSVDALKPWTNPRVMQELFGPLLSAAIAPRSLLRTELRTGMSTLRNTDMVRIGMTGFHGNSPVAQQLHMVQEHLFAQRKIAGQQRIHNAAMIIPHRR